jgi:hypothetical protein
MIVVLDTQGLEVLADRGRRARSRLRAIRQDVDDIVVPAAVLAEGVLTGNPAHDVPVHRLLRESDVAEVTARTGFAAGALRRSALRAGGRTQPSGVDAIVVAVADQRAASDHVVIVTSDPGDLTPLARACQHADRLTIGVV